MIIVIAICFLLLLLYAGLILYYRIAWNNIPEFLLEESGKELSTKIVVIIPARNEAANIQVCLDSISSQSYPAHLFEVLVIDDHSTDDTAAIVKNYSKENIRLVALKDHLNGKELNSFKKKAIGIGIQQSTGELIVTTDADCYLPKNWLQTIAAFYEKYHPSFIAAPVSINSNFNFIEIFQALDFITLQGITGASVHKKVHSMCNGANLAYERAAFDAVDGFAGIDHIASGDDMMLMHKIYKRFPGNVMFLRSKEAIVQTAPLTSVKAFLNQRIRWASKADKYDDKKIMAVLVLVYLFNVLLFLLPVISIFSQARISIYNHQYSLVQYWLFLIIVKTIVELIFLFPVAGFFNKRSLLWLFPVMQPFHILYTVIAGWLGKFGTYHWKERKVK